MLRRYVIAPLLLLACPAIAAQKTVVALHDFSKMELKSAGFDLSRTTTFHITARGAGNSQCDNDGDWKDRDDMFAYGWILDANTRQPVWKMEKDNTSRSRDDRTFDGDVTLKPGSYEIYFTASTFTYISTFKNMTMNIDHREKGLFNFGVRRSDKGVKGWFEGWFDNWFGDDVKEEWQKRATEWGIELYADEGNLSAIKNFSPPKEMKNVVLRETKLGEREFIRKDFVLSEPTKIHIYALGEGYRNEYDLADYGWIVKAGDRSRVWEMRWKNSGHAGGASKNAKFDGEVSLTKGDYTLYFVTDDSHSEVDWNCAPPSDPLNYGVTFMMSDKEKGNFKLSSFKDDANVILSVVKVGNDESRSEGFTLKKDAKIRVYALGERSHSRRIMADYAVILDARTRTKVWTMDADNSNHAGGASKNRFVDEIISLPKGSYIVQYNTDDSHAYDDWNSDPPFDPAHYGVMLYGVGEDFSPSIVAKYVDQRDRNAIAQLIKVGDDAHKQVKFKLDKTTRIRVYAIGEGQNREMADYGWITDSRTGTTVWEMTYSMTVHAGGARKNRMVNTTILLDRGDYTLHYETDDSHAYKDWNMDPPEDPEYWGITLYPDEGAPVPPPLPPENPKQSIKEPE
ncbi:MAG: hypothetical protein HY961_01890 [Ignavibacteriae bacterium]|nr:hypothetical protein [Ignavibacteriota bacterium]